jgi:hypothetical protein
MSKTFNLFMTRFVVVFLFFANHSSALAETTGSIKSDWCFNVTTTWSDFNGDGYEDMHCDQASTGDHWVLISNEGTGSFSPPSSYVNKDPAGGIKSGWCKFGTTSWSKFNDDKFEDMHCDNATNGNHSVLISEKGTGLLRPPDKIENGSLIKPGWCKGGTTSWSDFDGDGYEDMHCDQASTGNHWVLISNKGKGDFSSPSGFKDNPSGFIEQGWCIGGGVTSWSDFDKDLKNLEDLHCDNPLTGEHSVLISDGMGNLNPL